jgi:hypothetical protein
MRRMFTSAVTAAGVAAALFGAVPCYAAYQYHPTPSYNARSYNARSYNARSYNSRTYNSRM